MKAKERRYISIYFSDGLLNRRKRRDFTVVFCSGDELYLRCKGLGSSGIRRILGTDSYAALVEMARHEDRPLGNYIKHRLRTYFSNEKKDSSG